MIYSEWLRWRACDNKMRWPSSVVARNWATLHGWHVATVRDEREAA